MPSGWLLCDGSAISRETYSALFDAVGTAYGAGDGSTNFNIPNLVDKFIEGAATAGTVKAAGLPEITGGFVSYRTATMPLSGAFDPASTISWANAPQTLAQGTYAFYTDTFRASRSNSIYGNSNTVQPPALTMRYAIYTGSVGKHCWLRTA